MGPATVAPGMHVTPGPLAWTTERRILPGSDGDPVAVVVIRIEHATGSTVLPVIAEAARAFAGDIIRAADGLEIATRLPT